MKPSKNQHGKSVPKHGKSVQNNQTPVSASKWHGNYPSSKHGKFRQLLLPFPSGVMEQEG